MSKELILLHLPFGQHSKLNVRSGQTLREAIANILRKRRIKPELCTVCVGEDPDSQQVDLGLKLTACAKNYKELWVHSDCLELFQTVHHEFVSKNFGYAVCDVCHRTIFFNGGKCSRCKFNFHKKCWGGVPGLCESHQLSCDSLQTDSIRNICARLQGPYAHMATNVLNSLLPTNCSRAPSASTLTFDRSASSPNIIENTKLDDSSDLMSISQQTSDTSGIHTPQSAPPEDSGNFFEGAKKRAFHKKKMSESTDWSKSKLQKAVDTWVIKNNDVTIQEKIGQGTYGTVYKAYYFGTVAVKMLNISHPDIKQLASFNNEITLLKKARHGNILNFFGVIMQPNLAIVTQWCQGSSLYRHLYILENNCLDMVDVINICKQLSNGMCYLHSKTVLHRDLKSSNVFLTDSNKVKIGDFGLATVHEINENNNDENAPKLIGSIMWMAPEVIRMNPANPYSTKSDVYSFGIVLYELLSGKLPYESVKNRDMILYAVGKGFMKPDLTQIRSNAPGKLRSLFQNCIAFDPVQRPEFRQILQLMDNIRVGRLIKSASETQLSKSHSALDIL
ncbi:unnamed protein product [Bursaphelenchus okinawaensis]|uniref:Raf homolog serine/threonine-protein kinase n=1 Tax=Bursaphelenchus okinawaensis TaxID=465554 RepID=A0A811L9M6_9BILA|nr:unnamed protein product [Bursaphelenchus okinawaensis]CAG9120411.1 unnamed protein product [Bursaphelenchus okinawaensis]